MVSSVGLITTTRYASTGQEVSYVDFQMIEPTNYRVFITRDPDVVTSKGATTYERIARDGSRQDTIVSSGGFNAGVVNWEVVGSNLVLEDADGYRQEMRLITLDEDQLAFSYDLLDTTWMPAFSQRSAATQIYRRR